MEPLADALYLQTEFWWRDSEVEVECDQLIGSGPLAHQHLFSVPLELKATATIKD